MGQGLTKATLFALLGLASCGGPVGGGGDGACEAGEVSDCEGYCEDAEFVGDGECDEWLDCADLNWDGGDCEGSGDNGDVIVDWGHDTGFEDWASWIRGLGTIDSIASWLNSSFILPKDLTLVHKTCGEENAFYSPSDEAVWMCYELARSIAAAFHNTEIYDFSSEEASQATSDTWIFIVFHEVGHAFVDYFDLAITGGEETAVDEFSTIMLLWSELPEVVIYAAVYWELSDRGEVTPTAMADSHGLNMQRLYNMLCLVYGTDPSEYSWMVDTWPELAGRVGGCEYEYQQASDSWNTLLEPWFK